MLRNEKGFTLIELVMVIVILGLLAAVAVPKYQDLRTEAARAACEGVAGAASAATAINFAARLFSPAGSSAIINGSSLIAAMEEMPTGWTINGAATGVESINQPTLYNIVVSTLESPVGTTIPTVKAQLTATCN